jgi:hypothetical protein
MTYLIILKMHIFLHESNSGIYATKVMNKMFTNSSSIDRNAEIASDRRYDRGSNLGPSTLCVNFNDLSFVFLKRNYK